MNSLNNNLSLSLAKQFIFKGKQPNNFFLKKVNLVFKAQTYYVVILPPILFFFYIKVIYTLISYIFNYPQILYLDIHFNLKTSQAQLAAEPSNI
jgi:hypothetical protein